MLFELPAFKYFKPDTIDEAVSLLDEYSGRARILAGGTDLLGLMKQHLIGSQLSKVESLIDICSIPELTRIEFVGDRIWIGSAVKLTQILQDNRIAQFSSLLAQAAAKVGTAQLRNMGSLGGNLLQQPRCMYFRHPEFLCYKKGGDKCFALAGEHRDYFRIFQLGRCVAANPSDLAPALTALRAKAVLAGPEGKKVVSLHELYADADSGRENVLSLNQILLGIELQLPAENSRQLFLKESMRNAVDFALVSVAVMAAIEDNVCKDISLVLGGVGPAPIEAAKAEALLRGEPLDDTQIMSAAEEALVPARALRQNKYKISMAKSLVCRALKALGA